jgi:hypothetical protein
LIDAIGSKSEPTTEIEALVGALTEATYYKAKEKASGVARS